MDHEDEKDETSNYEKLENDFVTEVRQRFATLSTEISERNANIQERDDYIYGDRIERALDIPIGHDYTPVNWLRRSVEIHKNMFMGRGFQVISTYDSKTIASVGGNSAPSAQTVQPGQPAQAAQTNPEDTEKERVKVENAKQKAFAESRKNLIDSIIRDNGGDSLWADLAESASVVGDAAIKAWYDEDAKVYRLSRIEAIENLYVLWSKDDFRKIDAVAYAYQVSRQEAIRDYGADEDVATSPMGRPMEILSSQTSSQTPAISGVGHSTSGVFSSQPMVTILEVTGKIEGWGSDKGKCKRVPLGQETEINALIIGNDLTRLIDNPKKLPKYYILPNKRQRRRPWGMSDISDAAIQINLTYIETLSDWRTHASKVNFQKYKAFGFGQDTQLPKSESRKVQMLPMSEGQDIVRLDQGDSNAQDFKAQMEECKEQFVRETGTSRVLFDDPNVALNSNQALITSMKPTSDIAEAKKQLWSPIIVQIFTDALETIAEYEKDLKDLADPEENWTLKVMWPSIMQKEDPVFQQMLLNRFNSSTMSLQTYLEQQGETKEEIDRIRDEMTDPLTAAILGRIMGRYAETIVAPPQPDNQPQLKTSVNLRGDLTPNQEANLASQAGFNDGPFPASMGPQGTQGLYAQENMDNAGFLTGNPRQGGTPIFKDQQGNPQVPGQKNDTNTGQDVRQQINTQANNMQGTGAVSMPGSGASPVTPGGALSQAKQNAGG